MYRKGFRWYNSIDVRLYSTRHGYDAQWSLNQSRQQPIALCCLSSTDLVSLIFPSTSLWKVATNSSSGPCSMMARTLSIRPTDMRVASDLGRESMTWTMSHFTVGLHLCGKNLYATMPGSAVVPCIEYNRMASAGVNGNCLRCTLIYLLLFFGTVIIFEGARQRPHCKDARPYSTGTIQPGSVVTC